MEDAIGIAGAGRVAQALGRLLRERGEPVRVVASRTSERAVAAARFVGGVRAVEYSELPRHASRILIAVPDDALPGVAAQLAEAGMRGGSALHTSGARGLEVLAALSAQGVSCACLHPLQAVSAPEQGLAVLPGAAFGITGEPPAVTWAEHIVSLLNGTALRIPAAQRPLYHAAAVMASNYVVGLIDASVMLMKAAGVAEAELLRAIAPLVRASTDSALTLGPAVALTGPIERGDIETVSLHREALAGVPASVRELYRAAGVQVLALARRRGLCPAAAQKLEDLFREVW